MSNSFAFLFPGQGAQYPGMGKDFYEQFSAAREVFQEADEILGVPFSKQIFEGSSEELTLTKNSQIAIYITSIAILKVVQEQFPEVMPSLCAGLSLGEYTALTAAKKIGFTECLPLVKTRAEAMHAACEETKGGMHVVLGLTEEVVESILHDVNDAVWIANLNCPGQVVIAGSLEALSKAAEHLKAKGAKRVLPLEVSGAFHSALMRSAQQKLAPKIEATSFSSSEIELVMNVPGAFVSELSEMKRYLIDQVVEPVRWEKGIRAMPENSLFVEMGPGKTLGAMNKRIGVTSSTLSIEKVPDLDLLSQFLSSLSI